MDSDTATRWLLPVRDYDLTATLSSGQAFRWELRDQAWEGVIGERWVRLAQCPEGLLAETAVPNQDWHWLTNYLQTGIDLGAVLQTFPRDQPMQAAVAACRGLRLIRQDPWECLASFICSSTKQIVQIQQIIATLCKRFGSPLPVPAGHPPVYSFPTPERIATAAELELRECKMGFRAPNLLATAQQVAAGGLDLYALARHPLATARQTLMELPGVGPKIADCVLLFAYDFPQAFPVDVWMLRALRELYFSGRRPSLKTLRVFADTHFGPCAGYAQQYLFHYMRVTSRKKP